MFNNVMLIGRLTRNVELRYTQSGKPCASFSIAVNRPYSTNGQKETDFINIVAWDKLAENVNKYTSKGSLVGIEGRLQTRSFEGSDGKRKLITEVLAKNIQFLDTKEKQEEKQSNDPFEEFGEKIENDLPVEENLPW